MACAGELPVSSKSPVVVMAPDTWRSAKDNSALATVVPFETFQVTPAAPRNAVCFISVVEKPAPENTNLEFLRKAVRVECKPYTNDPAKVEIKDLKIDGGVGVYANFVDPDLVGKPVTKGEYKSATLMYVGLGPRYFIKVTVLCDDLNGADYREAMQIVESLKTK